MPTQGFVVPLPQRLFDANGLPAAGWKIRTKVAGTNTDLATYSDAGLTSLNTNPIVADASGYFRMFVAEAVLIDLTILNASDVQQFTFLSLEPMPDTTASAGSVTAVPAGGIIPYGGTSAPTGFLLCDGSLVSRATYATLFGIISTAYGVGDGATTFGLPDMRGRFPLGKAAAGTGSTLGGTGGALDHTHTGAAHTHDTTVPRTGWGDLGVVENAATGYLKVCGTSGGGADVPTADRTFTSTSGGDGTTGTANPAFQTVNYIIKT